MIPILSMYFSCVGLMGSFVNVHGAENTSFLNFFMNGFSTIGFIDVFSALFKSILFGFTIGMIGCYKGYNATKGTQGVGAAANKAVVLSMFAVFIEEVVVVQISNWIKNY